MKSYHHPLIECDRILFCWGCFACPNVFRNTTPRLLRSHNRIPLSTRGEVAYEIWSQSRTIASSYYRTNVDIASYRAWEYEKREDERRLLLFLVRIVLGKDTTIFHRRLLFIHPGGDEVNTICTRCDVQSRQFHVAFSQNSLSGTRTDDTSTTKYVR